MSLNQKVFLVDDDDAIADALSFLLEGFGYQVVWFDDGQRFLDSVDLSQPGCVILDSRMPGFSGQQVQQLLTQTQSPLAVIFLTGHGDVPMAVEALKQGAFDFFQKPVQGKELAAAITQAFAYSQQQGEKCYSQRLLASLTEREQEILRLVVAGNTNKQMAEQLFVAVRTIEVHRAKVMKKLKVTNMAELLKLAALLETAEQAQCA